MPENIVYILGAGFSAPLGVPVIATFLERARTLQRDSPDRYDYFREVFQSLKELAYTMTFYEADLENIEEAFSILEMGEYTSVESMEKRRTAQLICDVITHYTPEFRLSYERTNNPRDYVFGAGDHGQKEVGAFASQLCSLAIYIDGEVTRIEPIQDPAVRYSVVSLNYDRGLESSMEYLKERYGLPDHLGFHVLPGSPETADSGRCSVAKLHGSVELGPAGIVPPTWGKGRHPHIIPAWQRAHQELSRANQIRVIGYSLPENDSYFRYLLKSAGAASDHLKTIDVLCMDDPDGTVAKRYDAFVKPKKLRFLDGTTEGYLGALFQHDGLFNRKVAPGVALEDTHRALFRQKRRQRSRVAV